MDGTVYRRHWLETWIQRTAMVQCFGQASDRASQHAGPGCIGRHTVEAVLKTVLRVSGDSAILSTPDGFVVFPGLMS